MKADEDQIKLFIDHLSHREMAWFWRFAKSGHPFFLAHEPYHEYFDNRFKGYGRMTTAISKEIGHDERIEPKTDILLESRDEGKIGLWLKWESFDSWHIEKWVFGYTTAVSETNWPTLTEGVGAWIQGDYKLSKVDGVYNDG